AVGLRLRLRGDHATHDDRSREGDPVSVLLLEPDLHERRVQVLEGHSLRKIDPLAQPADGDAHHTTIPNCCEKRTSPSTMSRMSFMSLRNCRVRSMPMPKAKPWYSSGSMPADRSTLGLTMPHPPHSTQRAPPLAFGCQTSISALGSVNGKKLGRNRIRASSPN